MERQNEQSRQLVVMHHHVSDQAPGLSSSSIPAQSIERLTQAINTLNCRSTLWYSFWHGLLVGIGSTVGVAAVLYLIYWVLSALDFLPAAESLQHAIKSLINNQTGQ